MWRKKQKALLRRQNRFLLRTRNKENTADARIAQKKRFSNNNLNVLAVKNNNNLTVSTQLKLGVEESAKIRYGSQKIFGVGNANF